MDRTTNNGFPRISFTTFGSTKKGEMVNLYTLVNKNGIKVDITNYGGLIIRLFVPDREGRLNDIALGYNTLEEYIEDSPYFGAVVGRYGNRIAGARFELDGKTYELPETEGNNHLHGGIEGFDKKVWEPTPYIKEGNPGLSLSYLSEDGEEGYPGNLEVTVDYCLTENNSLKIEYKAVTDKATPINLTQHSYFNLKGEGRGDIYNHILKVNADEYLPLNEEQLPTGEISSVKGTPLDFTTPQEIGERIDEDFKILNIGGGYDLNYVINKEKENEMVEAAEVYEPVSGREMKVKTTEPGVQLYTANNLEGMKGKSGRPYKKHHAICLETQHYPDSPNHDNFPSTILRPGENYQTVTEYQFSVR
ncbi:MAG: aldose epimerase family protein [Bacillota bacterium]